MKKNLAILLSCYLAILLSCYLRPALAVECEYDLKFYKTGESLSVDPIEGQFDSINLSIKVWDTGDFYTISSDGPAVGLPDQVRFRQENLKPGADGWLPTQTVTTVRLLKAGTHFFSVINERLGSDYCSPITFTVAPAPSPTSSFINCRLEAVADDNKFAASSLITIKGTNIPPLAGRATYQLRVRSRDGKIDQFFPVGLLGNSFFQDIGSFNYNTYDVLLRACERGCVDTFCQTQFTIDPTQGGAPTPLPTGISITPPPPAKLEDLCKNVKELNACVECIRSHGAWTALGCIPTDLSRILKDYIFVYGLGIAGGIAFLMILFGGFKILTSTGNPESIAQGGQMITSALAGLLIIIFSVAILKLIGVDIFKIPGFQ